MNLFVYLRSLLLTLSPVTALVGSGANARIWNEWARTSGLPCIILDIDIEHLQNDLAGRSTGTVAEITITCRGGTHEQSDAVSDAVKAIAGHDGEFSLVFDDIVHASTPRDDGTSGRWYDHIMSGVAIWNENIP